MTSAMSTRAQADTAFAWLVPLATALLVRVASGYRPFPGADDFTYVPTALTRLDPGLFSRDLLLTDGFSHTGSWTALVWLLEATVGLVDGWWLTTMLLSVATVTAVWSLFRGLGLAGWLLPVAVAIGLCGRADGIGRAAYEGSFGAGVHMQWAAACALLWSYDAFLRGRAAVAGALLALTAWLHPVVAAHGAVALVVAAPWTGRGGLARLVVAGVVSALLSVPTLVAVLGAPGGDTAAADIAAAVERGLRFRLPAEYDLPDWPALATLLAVVLGGAVGAALLARHRRGAAARPLAALMIAHLAIAGAGVFFYIDPTGRDLAQGSMLAYLLSLSRTSSLAVTLAAVLLAAGIEAALAAKDGKPADAALSVLAFLLLIGLLIVDVAWHPAMAVAVALGLALALAERRPLARPALSLALAAAGATALWWSATQQVRAAPVPEAQAGLYAWVRAATPADALFVTPPGFYQFRYYARRSVYVDFKTFDPGPRPALILEWRRRLDEVAAPDEAALEASGWPGVPLWDASYARGNDAERIAWLLRRTGADYLLWDAEPLGESAAAPAMAGDTGDLDEVFANSRYRVYRLRR